LPYVISVIDRLASPSLTFPTALLLGVLFTFLGEALKGDVAVETQATRWLILANTIGAMSGPLAAAFIVLPQIGMEGSFFELAITYAVVGFVACGAVPKRRGFQRWAFAATISTVVMVAAFPFGLMTRTYFPRATQPYAMQGEETIATLEGSAAPIFLMQNSWVGKPIRHRLVTNGYSMMATVLPAKRYRYMRYFAYRFTSAEQPRLSRSDCAPGRIDAAWVLRQPADAGVRVLSDRGLWTPLGV
jgi:spermidine synthase